MNMEKIYKAFIVRHNEEEYRGTSDVYVGYFKSQTNAWKKIADIIRNDFSGKHIISYKKVDGEIVRYSQDSDIILEELLPDIEQGIIRLVNNYGTKYYFYATPITIEDENESISEEELTEIALAKARSQDYVDGFKDCYRYFVNINK